MPLIKFGIKKTKNDIKIIKMLSNFELQKNIYQNSTTISKIVIFNILIPNMILFFLDWTRKVIFTHFNLDL